MVTLSQWGRRGQLIDSIELRSMHPIGSLCFITSMHARNHAVIRTWDLIDLLCRVAARLSTMEVDSPDDDENHSPCYQRLKLKGKIATVKMRLKNFS
ncbi:hypothetical protein TNCV_2010191 [Trichonephila clavipes]|nr:hypothetical protein TNCV_2010191 [Trichonephila clavipes]